MRMRKGNFILLVGPPGVGKSAVVENLLERNEAWVRLITTTTRKPRRGEEHGVDYFFLTKSEFQEAIKEGDFLEWMNNYGNLYGSSRSRLEEQLTKHPFVIGIIDVKGALRIKEIRPETQIIFMEPDDQNDCVMRLQEREELDSDELARRIANIDTELSYKDAFDWTVINRDGDMGFVLRSLESLLKDL